jgi:mitochondrial intermediate peptidase
VYENPSLYKSQVSEQEYQVGRLLIEDFEKSGIHMEKDKRKAYVSLYDKILQNGQEFVTNAGPAIDHIEISNPYTVLEGLPKEAIASLVSYSEKEDTALIPIGHPISHYILKCGNEIVREKVWRALNSGSDRQIHVLEEMLKTRHDIANLVGRNNYAEVHLQDKMAKTPGKNIVIIILTLPFLHRNRIIVSKFSSETPST